MRRYNAIIWTQDRNQSGKRVEVEATSLTEAKVKLEAEYGVGTVFDLHNEEDAARPR